MCGLLGSSPQYVKDKVTVKSPPVTLGKLHGNNMGDLEVEGSLHGHLGR
jgi:hypothetical protein